MTTRKAKPTPEAEAKTPHAKPTFTDCHFESQVGPDTARVAETLANAAWANAKAIEAISLMVTPSPAVVFYQ